MTDDYVMMHKVLLVLVFGVKKAKFLYPSRGTRNLLVKFIKEELTGYGTV